VGIILAGEAGRNWFISIIIDQKMMLDHRPKVQISSVYIPSYEVSGLCFFLASSS